MIIRSPYNADESHQHELKKYIEIYTVGIRKGASKELQPTYEVSNWGEALYDHIFKVRANSLLDVGCGRGQFVNYMYNTLKIPKVYGLDIASVRTNQYKPNKNITWIDAMAHNIPLPDSSVEYITSFDCLEHCLLEDIDAIVDEFARVCTKGLFLSICYRQSKERTKDRELVHMTVKNESWWVDKFSRKFELDTEHETYDADASYNTYLIFNKKK